MANFFHTSSNSENKHCFNNLKDNVILIDNIIIAIITINKFITRNNMLPKVQSFSQLNTVLGRWRTPDKRSNVCTQFLACGKEKYPMEMLVAENHKRNKGS